MAVLKNEKEVYRCIIILIYSIIFIILILEIVLRFFSPSSSLLFKNHMTGLWYKRDFALNKNGPVSIFRPSSSLGYELVPNSNTEINSLGMIDKERAAKKAENTYRIICVGDSTTASSEYVSILEEILNKNKNGRKFEVWNCGVSGYGAVQYCQALKEKWLKYNPDMVIIGFCLNDFDTTPLFVREKNNLVAYYPHYEVLSRINPFLLSHSALYRFIIMRLFVPYKIDPYENIVEQSQLSIKNTANLMSEKKVGFLIVIFGLVEPLEKYPGLERNYNNIKGIVKDCNIESIDMVPVFENYAELKQLQRFPGDELHFKKNGSEIIADAIYSYLNQAE